MAFKKTLYTWLTTRLVMTVRNEETFEATREIPYTRARVLVLGFLAFMITFVMAFLLSNSLNSSQEIITSDTELSSKLVELNMAIDSLAIELDKRDNYIKDIKAVAGGNKRYLSDKDKQKSQKIRQNELPKKKDIDHLEGAEFKLRREFESEESNFSSIFAQGQGNSFKDMFFFTPVNGIVTQNAHQLNGMKLLVSKEEPVKVIADGTVILATWTQDLGYAIAVQHKSELVSVYKNCQTLAKTKGDKIVAGEVIAIVGKDKKSRKDNFLRFELWHEGKYLNPQRVIGF